MDGRPYLLNRHNSCYCKRWNIWKVSGTQQTLQEEMKVSITVCLGSFALVSTQMSPHISTPLQENKTPWRRDGVKTGEGCIQHLPGIIFSVSESNTTREDGGVRLMGQEARVHRMLKGEASPHGSLLGSLSPPCLSELPESLGLKWN